jgi:hypothetical protein
MCEMVKHQPKAKDPTLAAQGWAPRRSYGNEMSDKKKVSSEAGIEVKQGELEVHKNAQPTPRREFLRQLGGVAAATMAAGSVGLAPLVATASAATTPIRKMAKGRMQDCYDIRMDAARETGKIAMPAQITNGDEQRYPDFIGNYSKGLPHNAVREVDPDAYRLLIAAGESGTSAAYEKVPISQRFARVPIRAPRRKCPEVPLVVCLRRFEILVVWRRLRVNFRAICGYPPLGEKGLPS